MKNLILLLAAFMMNFASVNGSAINGPSMSESEGGCLGTEVTLTINLDDFPGETSWEFVSLAGDTIASGGGYVGGLDSVVVATVCLEGCVTFTINDAFGDGICCAFGLGDYSIVSAAGDTLVSGGEFGASESTPIGCDPTCDDGILNGDEEDVDCGGTLCEPCPTCDDGIFNNGEVEIDCGGPNCAPCVCTGDDVMLTIDFDDFAGETSWSIVNDLGGVVASGSDYLSGIDTLLMENICLNDGCYEFIILDSFGDGICCGFGLGSYNILNAAGDTLAQGGEFLAADTAAFCVTSAGCQAPTDLDVVEIDFGGANARVNATWTNPEGTTDCEVRGGRISPASFDAGEPEFANVANTLTITQTDGSTVLFNVVLYNNPNVPFVVGQRYGYEVRCQCADGSGFSEYANITPESTFVVPTPPAGVDPGVSTKLFNAGIDMMKIFPNPAENMVNIELEMLEEGSVEILLMNAVGQTVMQERSSGKSLVNRLDISDLDAGVYMVTIRTNSGMITDRLIVK